MAASDLIITPASVLKGAGARYIVGTLGETVTAGCCMYLKSSDGKYYRAFNNGSEEQAAAVGIALNGGSINQPVVIQTDGLITIGASLAGLDSPAVSFIVSDNLNATGRIIHARARDDSEFPSPNSYQTILGWAASATLFQIQIVVTGLLLSNSPGT